MDAGPPWIVYGVFGVVALLGVIFIVFLIKQSDISQGNSNVVNYENWLKSKSAKIKTETKPQDPQPTDADESSDNWGFAWFCIKILLYGFAAVMFLLSVFDESP